MLPSALETVIRPLIEGFSGRIGFAVHRPGEALCFGENETEIFATASTIKLAILITTARAVELGRASWNDALTMTVQDQVGGSGVLKDLSPGLTLPLRDVATLMITLSDNTATNMLIDYVGLAVIGNDLHALGYRSSALHRKIRFDAEATGPFAVSTAADLSRMISDLKAGRLLGAEGSAICLDILRRQQYRDLIARDLPFSPYGEGNQQLRIANKTGFSEGLRADVALIELPGLCYSLAVLTTGSQDLRFHPDNEAALVIGRLARIIFDFMTSSS